MKNEQRTAKREHPATPTLGDAGPSDPMTPDELTVFEENIVQGGDSEPPADPTGDPERMTKSGRLDLEQVQDVLDASEKDDE